jgi:hypothetical protein
MTQLAIIVLCFVEYLPEDGEKRPEHVAGLPHFLISLHPITAQLLVYVCMYVCMYVCNVM